MKLPFIHIRQFDGVKLVADIKFFLENILYLVLYFYYYYYYYYYYQNQLSKLDCMLKFNSLYFNLIHFN